MELGSPFEAGVDYVSEVNMSDWVLSLRPAACSGSRRGWPPASCAAARRRSGWIPTRPMRSPTPTPVSRATSRLKV